MTILPVPLVLPASIAVACVDPNTAEDGPHCSTVSAAPGLVEPKAPVASQGGSGMAQGLACPKDCS